jgi:hypothetical protein
MDSVPDRRSARDHGPYSGYCKVCWNAVYVLWIEHEPPPGTCVHGMACAAECPDALGRAKLSADVQKYKRSIQGPTPG